MTFVEPITSIVASIPSPFTSHAHTPPIIIPQVSIPIPTHVIPQPAPLVTVHELSTPIVDEVADFGEDVVVLQGEYFWSRA